ncbi:MAG: polymer-forming cytoskeletal protein [Planctomycetes bacterium]|nr:polymer-forming cytoskeletal protein [Planctomycetota bacterium]
MGWSKRKEEVMRPQPMAAMEQAMPVESAPALEPSSAVPTLGAGLQFRGDLSGSEDVRIDGRFEGRIDLSGHTLTIGSGGLVRAEVRARCVVIAGEVVGDVTAEDRVEVTATGSLVGDIRAGRVVLAEDARFKGRIDMGWEPSAAEEPAAADGAEAAPAREGGDSLAGLSWGSPKPEPAGV